MGGEPAPERLRGPVTLRPSFTFPRTLRLSLVEEHGVTASRTEG